MSTGIQLEQVSKDNPLHSKDVAEGGEDESKPPASNEARPPLASNDLPPPPRTPPVQPPSKASRTSALKDPNPPANPNNTSEPPASTATGQIVESSTTHTPSVSTAERAEHITECATTWSIVGFVLTSAHTAIYAAFAVTKDDVYRDFYAWIVKPTCFTAMVISFSLKPRRTDLGHMFLLYSQYGILTLGTEVSGSCYRCLILPLSPLFLLLSHLCASDLHLDWRRFGTKRDLVFLCQMPTLRGPPVHRLASPLQGWKPLRLRPLQLPVHFRRQRRSGCRTWAEPSSLPS